MVGQAGFSRYESRKLRHKGNISGVYVTPGARQRGGQGHDAHMLDRARAYSGLDQVTLSVAVQQDAARRLYRALGFEVYGFDA